MADLLPSSPDTSAADDGDPRVVGLDSDEADDVLAALSSGTARELLSALHDDPGTPSELADRVDTSLQNTQYHLEKLEGADVVRVIDTVYSEKGREMEVYAPTDQPLVVFAGDEEEETGLRAALSRLIGGIGAVAGASLIVQRLAPNVATGGADAGTGDRSTGGESSNDDAASGGGADDGSSESGSEETAGGDGSTDGTDDSGSPNGDASGAEDGDSYANGAENGEESGDWTTADAEDESGSADDGSADDGGGSAGADDGGAAADDGGAGGGLDLPLLDDGALADLAGAGLPPGALFFAGGATVVVAWFVLWYVRIYRA